jgi:acetyl esterase/lipase
MVRNVTSPTLTAFLPDPATATGAAVVVCPGGGFRFLSWESEGTRVAEWLQRRGVAAFVLRYRLKETAGSEDEFRKEMEIFFRSLAGVRDRGKPANQAKADRPRSPSLPEDSRKLETLAIADGQQALRVVRQHAAEWGIKPNRIGIMGFSAGGVVTMGVARDHDAESLPNFAAAIYGPGSDQPRVPEDAPPLFILCTADDPLAEAGSVRLYSEWRTASRPVELHIYETGGHGFGMTPRNVPADHWIERFGDWLGQRGLIQPDPTSTPATTNPGR